MVRGTAYGAAKAAAVSQIDDSPQQCLSRSYCATASNAWHRSTCILNTTITPVLKKTGDAENNPPQMQAQNTWATRSSTCTFVRAAFALVYHSCLKQFAAYCCVSSPLPCSCAFEQTAGRHSSLLHDCCMVAIKSIFSATVDPGLSTSTQTCHTPYSTSHVHHKTVR